MFENALSQFWEHNDRCGVASGNSVQSACLLLLAFAVLHQAGNLHTFTPYCRLEKCASLLSRKDLAAVQRRYQQMEVRRVCSVHAPRTADSLAAQLLHTADGSWVGPLSPLHPAK